MGDVQQIVVFNADSVLNIGDATIKLEPVPSLVSIGADGQGSQYEMQGVR
ncbi:hypothetical protein [Saccharothrix deserti]|nr:hypothetical protein [Saccharothrix deserti]